MDALGGAPFWRLWPALIGSFIAATFATPFKERLLRIGMLAYAVYVVLFPGALGLLSNARAFLTERGEFDHRSECYEELLFPDKVKSIIADRFDKAKKAYFRHRAAVWAAFRLPSLVR
jgi:hypothetical protein